MTTLQIIGSIWAFVAVCSVLFIRGATQRKTHEERLNQYAEEV